MPVLSFVPASPRPAPATPDTSLGRFTDDLQLLALHDPSALRVLARMAARFALKIRQAV